MNIFQHRLASGFVASIAIIVCYISFTRQPSDAYLFPRVISVFFLTLALWTFVKALMGLSKVGNGLSAYMFKNNSWVKRIIITACFIAIMYTLFAKILVVYTPRGMFI